MKIVLDADLLVNNLSEVIFDDIRLELDPLNIAEGLFTLGTSDTPLKSMGYKEMCDILDDKSLAASCHVTVSENINLFNGKMGNVKTIEVTKTDDLIFTLKQ